MSCNIYRDHIFVLPEDDANRDIANGFSSRLPIGTRQIQLLPNSGGWTNACDKFVNVYIKRMRNSKRLHVVLLIDFDRQDDRLTFVKTRIPEDLTDRVFVLGAWSTPEELRKANLGTFEEIGGRLADDCHTKSENTWGHELLKHNADELARMTQILRPIIFPN
jgi:hypothetical protein